tara:strand:+ start:6178 stop:8022 length:1845 start_codon:yes stop_codon:yes gene_type:complete
LFTDNKYYLYGNIRVKEYLSIKDIMDFLKLIQEGRVDDFKAKYSQKFGTDNANKIIVAVPQKYLDWAGKHLDMVNFEENLSKVAQALQKFEKISSNLPITDLFQYKNIGQLLSALSDYYNRQRRVVNKVEGGNVVYDDGRYFVVNPLTHDSSCYYGKGTKWCTSADTDHQFKKYNEDGKLFYILDKNATTNDKFYKVALLQKFDGDRTYYDALDETVKNGWILNTNKLNQILSSVDEYIKLEYPEQVKIYTDKELAKKEKQRLANLRIQQILKERQDEAQERRLNGEWTLDDNCPEIGLKAHALLINLSENFDVDIITNQDIGEIARIQNEIDRLQLEYDNDEEVRGDLLDEISELEDEITEFENKIDVYNIIPTGSFYSTSQFEVIGVPNLEDRTYAVGDEDEMQRSAYDYVDQLIDDIGYRGFNPTFAKEFIDENAVISYAEDLYNDDVYNNTENYLDNSERNLSDEQEEKIGILNSKIEKYKSLISSFEDEIDNDEMESENNDEIIEKIDELNDEITEMETEIQDEIENPDGSFPDDLIEDIIKKQLDEVKYDVTSFMDEWGLDWEEYVDKDEFINGVVDADGYGHTLNGYDGTAEEITVLGDLYYVMRID